MMHARYWILLGSLLAGTAVALGAYGAHGLPKRLAAAQLDPAVMARRLDNMDKAVDYHMYHALALIVLGVMLSRLEMPGAAWSGWLMVLGILCFSGWLYGFALAGSTRWPLITPFGGLCFLLAWANLAWAAWRAA